MHGNGDHEEFTRDEIGDRDGWVCGICGLVIDKTLRWPDRRSASLDHVVPLVLGGEHTRANSRITHVICNVRRGADRTVIVHMEDSCPSPSVADVYRPILRRRTPD